MTDIYDIIDASASKEEIAAAIDAFEGGDPFSVITSIYDLICPSASDEEIAGAFKLLESAK
jgi:hypothetical protein